MKILWRQDIEEKSKQKSLKENEDCAKEVEKKVSRRKKISVIWAGLRRISIETKSQNLANRRLVVTSNNNFSSFCVFGDKFATGLGEYG